VTKNLRVALRNLRDRYASTGPALLWVDAICIDQANLEERSSQVGRLMRRIFVQAQQVVSWTGEDDEDIEDIVELYKKVSIAMEVIGVLSEDTSRSALIRAQIGVGFTDKDWQALESFLSRPYCSRVWVVPELAAQFGDDSQPAVAGAPCVVLCGFQVSL